MVAFVRMNEEEAGNFHFLLSIPLSLSMNYQHKLHTLNVYIFVYQPHLPIIDAEKIINWGGRICNHLYTFNAFRIREI